MFALAELLHISCFSNIENSKVIICNCFSSRNVIHLIASYDYYVAISWNVNIFFYLELDIIKRQDIIIQVFVFRLVEEVKDKCEGVKLQVEEVYMNTTFDEFKMLVVKRGRGIDDKPEFKYDAVSTSISTSFDAYRPSVAEWNVMWFNCYYSLFIIVVSMQE